MAQRFQLVCRFIKILYSPSLSSDTRILYIDCLRNFSTSHRRSEVNDVVDHEQRRSDTIDENNMDLIYDDGLETPFSGRIRQTLRQTTLSSECKIYLIARRLRNCVDQEAFDYYLQLSSLHL